MTKKLKAKTKVVKSKPATKGAKKSTKFPLSIQSVAALGAAVFAGVAGFGTLAAVLALFAVALMMLDIHE